MKRKKVGTLLTFSKNVLVRTEGLHRDGGVDRSPGWNGGQGIRERGESKGLLRYSTR